MHGPGSCGGGAGGGGHSEGGSATLCIFPREGSQQALSSFMCPSTMREMSLSCTCLRIIVCTLDRGRIVGVICVALLMLHEGGQQGTGLL